MTAVALAPGQHGPIMPAAVAISRGIARNVRHPKFGTGKVIRADDRVARIEFSDYGTKDMALAVAALEVVGDGDSAPARLSPAPIAITAPPAKPAGEHHAADVVLLNGASVKPEAVEWLWSGYLAAGKFEINAGAAGTGKTTLALSLAATITIGGRLPDGTISPLGDVAIWSGEDDPADTLAPRLLADGADMKRVHFVSGTVAANGEQRPFDPATDTAHLARALAGKNVKMLIVDPVVSAVAGDSHKGAETRRSLQPLVDLAAKLNCAVLGISHFSKGTQGRDPLERVTGSIAFGALARVVFATAKAGNDDAGDDGCDRLFVRSKSNIGPDGGGFRYALEQVEVPGHPGLYASRVRWGAALEGEARQLLATAEASNDDGEGGTMDDAKRFLASLLSDGPLPSKTIKADADGAGYSWATIRRAQKALGIDPVKDGMRGGWLWALPRRCSTNPEDAHSRKVSTFGEHEHLRDDLARFEDAKL